MSVRDPWSMDHYTPKWPYFLLEKGMTMWEVEHVFQLDPDPPAVEDENEYILRAQQQPGMDAFYLFLHHYEKRLNKRINQIIVGDCQLRYNPERFLDLKMACVIQLRELVPTYAPSRGAKFTTYVYPFLTEAVHRYCMEEEHWAIPSLDTYRQLRTAAFHKNQSRDMESAIETYMAETGCTQATAIRYLEDATTIRNQVPFWVMDPETRDELCETVDRDDSWNYVRIIMGSIRSQQVQDAFWSLREDRDRELLESRYACCMNCGKTSPMDTRASFDDLAIQYEYTNPSSAKAACNRSVKRLGEILWHRGVIHAAEFRLIREVKQGKKITAAVYRYQADCDGEWGELAFDFGAGTAVMLSLADWDTSQTKLYAKAVIQYLLDYTGKPPKSGTVYFP